MTAIARSDVPDREKIVARGWIDYRAPYGPPARAPGYLDFSDWGLAWLIEVPLVKRADGTRWPNIAWFGRCRNLLVLRWGVRRAASLRDGSLRFQGDRPDDVSGLHDIARATASVSAREWRPE